MKMYLCLRLMVFLPLLGMLGFTAGGMRKVGGGITAGSNTSRVTIKVGPGRPYSTPSAAAAIANDGDVIEILAGTYRGDVAVWRQNNLTIRGAFGRARLEAYGNNAEGKAIWVIKGNNTTVESIEFSGATVPDQNGAGIRQEGSGLTIRRCYFHDNENGILAGNNPISDIVIEYSEFANNGFGDGLSHNIYINRVRSFTLRYSYIHHAKSGHNVKSRALENYILYNRIMDEQTGTSSYAVDLPNGGTSYVIGNLIQQGPNTDNFHILSYGVEGLSNPSSDLYIVNNTIVNDRHDGRFIRVQSNATTAKLVNNIFYGPGNILVGPGESKTNLSISKQGFLGFNFDNSGFVNVKEFNYRLKSTSIAIDKGIDPGSVDGFKLTPVSHYVHVARSEKRIVIGNLDIGAYEFFPTKTTNKTND